MSTMIESISNVLRETIEQGLETTSPGVDNTLMQIMRSTEGVTKGDWGRTYLVKKVFQHGIAGTHGWRSTLGGTVALDGSGSDQVSMFGSGDLPTAGPAFQAWQGMEESTAPGFVIRTISLKEGFGHFAVPDHLAMADQLDSVVGPIVGGIAKGAVERIRLSYVHTLWKLDSAYSTNAAAAGAIGEFTGAGAAISAAGTLTITLTKGKIQSFAPGLVIDVYRKTSSAVSLVHGVNTTTRLVVQNVNYLARQFTVIAVNDATSTFPAETLMILPDRTLLTTDSANTRSTPSGWVDWIKSSGTVFGISLTTNPWLRSIKDLSNSGALTGDKLNYYITGFHEAYQRKPSALITTPGVITGLLDNVDTSNVLRYDVQGEAKSVVAGFAPFAYVYDGMKIDILSTTQCFTGTVILTELNGNIKRYVPPAMPGAGKGGMGFSGEVQFWAPSYGLKSIFMPGYNAAAALVDGRWAPYKTFCEFCPDRPQSIMLGTFSESSYSG